MFNLELPDLYAILDYQTCLERDLDPIRVVKSWLDAGIQLIQIRAKALQDREYWSFAEAVQELNQNYDSTLLINARVDIAVGLELDGVHLPSHGLPIDAILNEFPNLILFASCHNEQEIEARRSADAITLSPMFSPLSKPDDMRQTLELSAFETMSQSHPGKCYALGGIDEQNIQKLKGIPVASLGFLCHENAYENAKFLLARGNL